jgi:hypothetical protein
MEKPGVYMQCVAGCDPKHYTTLEELYAETQTGYWKVINTETEYAYVCAECRDALGLNDVEQEWLTQDDALREQSSAIAKDFSEKLLKTAQDAAEARRGKPVLTIAGSKP